MIFPGKLSPTSVVCTRWSSAWHCTPGAHALPSTRDNIMSASHVATTQARQSTFPSNTRQAPPAGSIFTVNHVPRVSLVGILVLAVGAIPLALPFIQWNAVQKVICFCTQICCSARLKHVSQSLIIIYYDDNGVGRRRRDWGGDSIGQGESMIRIPASHNSILVF